LDQNSISNLSMLLKHVQMNISAHKIYIVKYADVYT